jgi:prepilin-type N-terminal cleavage/methylation domain-containing protein
MLRIMLGCRRFAGGRSVIGQARPVVPGFSPRRRPAAPPISPRGNSAAPRAGFTLIELLIVIGLLGAVAMVMLASFNTNREETLDNSVVQKELSDIQRAFHRLNADCVLRQGDLKTIAQYGLAVLMTEGILSGWDADKGKGWRGPYVEREGARAIDSASIGQQAGTAAVIAVVETPYTSADDDGHYYRVVATEQDTSGSEPVERVIVPMGDIHQLWVVSPDRGGLPAVGDLIETFPKEFRRRLLLDRE